MGQREEIIEIISSSDVNLSTTNLLGYLSNDVEYFMLANRRDAPLLRQLRGKSIVAEYLSILPKAYEIVSRSISKISHDGPYTMAFGRDSARIYPDRREIISDWSLILFIQSGKIRNIQYIFHNMTDAESISA